MTRLLLCSVCLLWTTTRCLAGDRWPQWRGVDGQGHAQATNVPLRWSETENVAWKVALPGRGWSSPVVENGQVWVTTAVDTPESKEEALRRRKTSTNSQPLTISDFASFRAVGVDLDSGKVLREVEVLSERDPQMIHIDNTYATPTPIIENARLYCYYGPSGIACLDVTSGKVLWENRTLRVKHENGAASSPVLWNDLLIIHCDGIDKQYVVALDKRTGKRVWTTPRTGKLHDNPQMRKSYATSLATTINGAPLIVSPGADWVYGYDPASGRELWKLAYGQLGFSNAGRPIAGHGLVFATTGYTKSQLIAFEVNGAGGNQKPEVVWRYNKQVPKVASPLLVGGELYFASDNGVATCLDARTGKAHWVERIGKRYWASPVYANGRIYFFDRDATTTVVAPGKQFHRLAENHLDGEMLATAAVVEGSIILRSDKALYCIR